MDPFHVDSPRILSLEEGIYIDIISDTPLKVGLFGKPYKKFACTLERRSLTSAGKL
jgi:hypothetical protein